MSEAEDKLRADLEKAKQDNLNMRFDNVENQLTEITKILKEYNKTSTGFNDRLILLEENKRTFNAIKQEIIRYSKETSFIRDLFKNPLKGTILVTIYIIIIVTLVLVFGPEAIFQTLLKLKGL